MSRRVYTGPLVGVSFDGDLCRHAAAFLREVVARCPSSALEIAEPGVS